MSCVMEVKMQRGVILGVNPGKSSAREVHDGITGIIAIVPVLTGPTGKVSILLPYAHHGHSYHQRNQPVGGPW